MSGEGQPDIRHSTRRRKWPPAPYPSWRFEDRSRLLVLQIATGLEFFPPNCVSCVCFFVSKVTSWNPVFPPSFQLSHGHHQSPPRHCSWPQTRWGSWCGIALSERRPPGESVIIEQANLTRLVIGCIEANFFFRTSEVRKMKEKIRKCYVTKKMESQHKKS